MVDRGLIIAQVEYHSSQVVCHGNVYSISSVAVHFPDRFLSFLLLLLLLFFFLYLLIKVILIFSWRLLL
jgi:hypothetical protein